MLYEFGGPAAPFLASCRCIVLIMPALQYVVIEGANDWMGMSRTSSFHFFHYPYITLYYPILSLYDPYITPI